MQQHQSRRGRSRSSAARDGVALFEVSSCVKAGRRQPEGLGLEAVACRSTLAVGSACRRSEHAPLTAEGDSLPFLGRAGGMGWSRCRRLQSAADEAQRRKPPCATASVQLEAPIGTRHPARRTGWLTPSTTSSSSARRSIAHARKHRWEPGGTLLWGAHLEELDRSQTSQEEALPAQVPRPLA